MGNNVMPECDPIYLLKLQVLGDAHMTGSESTKRPGDLMAENNAPSERLPPLGSVVIDTTPGRSVAYGSPSIPWLVAADFLPLAILVVWPIGLYLVLESVDTRPSSWAPWFYSLIVLVAYYWLALNVVGRKRLGILWAILILFPVTSTLAYFATLALSPKQRGH